ncbi:hypothetical protein [Mesorhizobium sp.]|uniref:hypothetical protein n=1 Tax=Mesorhizobium sp. TaxID=1871066 RepID=UPI000FE78160|nr:hypothetical protein [Mesorhizobium sp.]RWK65094.1 MAG: hypothetical protein EOR49_05325 [Mesorhizobium sp.]RWM43250.1 MAG: hypothetical protein EOR76_30445 [Mesorhizobium sp.]RWM55561.1 MAG: hypothetical protein EOR78_13785 [Mesorhizobium sp.]RWM60931.1 MAG: hypothetical protein EOR79_05275 [Mesorhizobium sp.]RWN05307.1 MAG: hypothetical protein EOR85_01080 [Mesorhizobium sp.]
MKRTIGLVVALTMSTIHQSYAQDAFNEYQYCKQNPAACRASPSSSGGANVYVPSVPSGGGGGGGLSAGEAALIGVGIGLLGQVIQQATSNPQPRQPSQSTQGKWRPTMPNTRPTTYAPIEPSAEELRLRQLDAFRRQQVKQQIETENAAKLAADSTTWGKFTKNVGWTTDDTREVQKGVAEGMANDAAKRTLGAWVNDTFGSGTAETQDLADKAADAMLNLKQGIWGVGERVGNVRDALQKDIQKWLDDGVINPMKDI